MILILQVKFNKNLSAARTQDMLIFFFFLLKALLDLKHKYGVQRKTCVLVVVNLC